MYGESKLAGEEAVQSVDIYTLVARHSFVYGVRGDTDELVGFPAWVCDALRASEEVPLFTDQHFTPTRPGQAATRCLNFLSRT